jgi:hypothetical protein
MNLVVQHGFIHNKELTTCQYKILDEGHGSWFKKKSTEPLQLCFFHNVISTYTKDFSGENMPKICQILKAFFFKLSDFYE